MAFVEKLLSGGGLVIAAGGVFAWQWATREPAPQFAATVDPSVSVARNCNGLREEMARVVEAAGTGKGSRMAVLVMGDEINPDPSLTVDEALPVRPTDVNGRAKKEAAFREERDQRLDRLEQACEAAPERLQSPVFQLVKRALAHLRSRDCGTGGRCYLLVKTDAIDDVEPKLRAVIERSVKNPDVDIPAELAGTLDNAGIEVTFCGGAELRARRKAKRDPSPETVERIWKALFSEPDRVSFKPYCGQ